MEKEIPIDTSDEEQVGSRVKTWELANQREREEVATLMRTYGGRAFIWRLLTRCKVNSFGYCGDNNYLNNIEGRRWIGGGIMEEVLTAAPKEYIIMRDDAVSRDAARKGKK